jgi:DNA-binding response OmpR family regulator
MCFSVDFQIAQYKIKMSMRILLVEDDPQMAMTLKRGLAEEGFEVFVAGDGVQGLEIALSCAMDCIVLDIMLPRMDGLEVTRRLRAKGVASPILMLTARDAPRDIIAGLDHGADDYLTKPFYFEVLLARLRAIIRRKQGTSASHFQVEDLVLDPATHAVTRAGIKIPLTKTEYRLLYRLISCTGTVVPREVLIENIWGFHGEIESNTLDAFVRLLRKKIDADFEPKLLHTVRGFGYCLKKGEE